MSKDLMSQNNNIFDKIKNFFKKLFVSDVEKIVEINDNIIRSEEDDILDLDKIKEEEKIESDRLFKLKEQFENEEITEEDISEEDKEKIKLLYADQIENLDYAINARMKELENLKQEIVAVKKK